MLLEHYTGNDATTYAKRKAMYGHRTWTVWVDKQGVRHAALFNKASIKAAMLAVGTQGTFYMCEENSEHLYLMTWGLGALNLRRRDVQ